MPDGRSRAEQGRDAIAWGFEDPRPSEQQGKGHNDCGDTEETGLCCMSDRLCIQTTGR